MENHLGELWSLFRVLFPGFLGSHKLDKRSELVGQLREEGHRALVFSQFTRHLELAKRVFDGAGVKWLYLDGATPQAERGALVDRFQAGEADVFLISLKAGGAG